MKRFSFFLVICLSQPAIAEDIVLIDANDLNWTVTPEGVAFAPLESDRFTEPYRAMVNLPLGTTSPAHMKSAAMVGVMIAGKMRHYAVGQAADAQDIGPGGFYRIPAGPPHVSACVSAAPCVTYLFQDAPFDFLPVAQ